MKQYDAIVVGAGVVGAAVARELSRRKGSFLVVERALDVCEGTSKANSAIVHAGFDAEPGTWKAKMNVAGNQSMDTLSQELDIPFRRVGAFVVCFAKEELPKLRGALRPGRGKRRAGHGAAHRGAGPGFGAQPLGGGAGGPACQDLGHCVPLRADLGPGGERR